MLSSPKKISTLFFLLVLVLFVFVFLIRTVGLFNNNALFLFDSARDFLGVNKLIIDHKPVLIGTPAGGLGGYFHGVIWYYLLAVPLILASGNPISGQWFMAIMSTISVLAAFLVLKKTMNIYAGILGILLFGFGNFSIATAKFTWNSYPIVWLAPILFLGIYLLVKRIRWGIILISLVEGLSLQFDLMLGLTTFPAYLAVFGYFILKGKTIGKIKYVLISILLIILPFLPSILFDLRHNFIISKAVVNTVANAGNNLSHKADELQTPLGKRISLRFSEMVQYSIGSMTTNSLVNYGLFLALLLSIYFMIKSKNRQNMILVTLSASVILSMFLVLLLLKYSVWSHYWTNNAPLYAMLLSFGIGYLIGKYRQRFLFGCIFILLFIVYQPWHALSFWGKGELNPGPQVLSTQLDVVKTIYNNAGNKKFSAYVQTPPVYDYVYRYLFWWQGSKKYQYIPTDQKQEIVYVILEGVPQDIDASYFKQHTLHLTTRPVQMFTFGDSFPRVEKFIIDPSSEQPVDPNFFPQL